MTYIIRSLSSEDEPFLWEMLYQALHVPEGQSAPPREVVRLPELARYVLGWGREGDCGFLASEAATGRPVGAVWLRCLSGEDRGYGYVAEGIPELSIAVLPGHRGRGLGARLLGQLFASACGLRPISLSVSAGNPARRLYERFGFEVVSRDAGSLTMRRD